MTYEWVPFEFPDESLQIRQVYAYARFPDGTFLVQRDAGRTNLPGGKPDAHDQDVIATLRRECLEESQVDVVNERLLGFVRITDEAASYAQLRYYAEISRVLPAAVDPATGRQYERLHVPLDSLDMMLNWGSHGAAQLMTLRELLGRE